jgi:hypothetical protein
MNSILIKRDGKREFQAGGWGGDVNNSIWNY